MHTSRQTAELLIKGVSEPIQREMLAVLSEKFGLVNMPVREVPWPFPTARQIAHSDHDLRHWDRTCPACPACKAEAAADIARHPDEFDISDYIAEERARNLTRVSGDHTRANGRP